MAGDANLHMELPNSSRSKWQTAFAPNLAKDFGKIVIVTMESDANSRTLNLRRKEIPTC